MSHVADCDLMVTDLDAFEIACNALGLELRRGQRTYAWFGTWVNDYSDPDRAAAARGFDPAQFGHCEHAVRIKGSRDGAYEMGLVPRRDGQPGWELLYDNFGSGREFDRLLGGGNVPKLKDEYGMSVSERYWKRKGYQVRRQVNAQGEPQVVAYQR